MYELAQVIGRNKVVMTIEDPVEVWNPDFLQTQVNLIAGITYPDLLKAALRHRPDILIIGEIRDQETAKNDKICHFENQKTTKGDNI